MVGTSSTLVILFVVAVSGGWAFVLYAALIVVSCEDRCSCRNRQRGIGTQSGRGTSGDYPSQPPTEFDLPQPEPTESTITYSHPSNPITTQPMPSDGTCTLTEVPPPAYDLQDT